MKQILKKKIYRTLLLIIFTNLFTLSFTFSQTNELRVQVSKMNIFISSGDFNHAAECADNLSESAPELFNQYIQNKLVYDIQKKNANASIFLKVLYNRKNNDIKKIVTPIYYYKQFLETNKTDSLDLLLNEYTRKIEKLNSDDSKTEFYSLLILKQLNKAKYVYNDLSKLLLNASIQSLKKNKNIDTKKVFNKNDILRRAWTRYMLSNLYYFEFNNTLSPDNEAAIKNAYLYSSDEIDLTVMYKFSYEGFMLWKNIKHLGFGSEYAYYLLSKGEKEETLKVLTQETVLLPTNEALSDLKKLYAEIRPTVPFSEYWSKSVEQYFKPVYNLSFRTLDNQKIKINNLKGSWIYLDVWGTWCGPCKADLPKVQEFYTENQNNEKSPLKIYTLSYNSTDLESFLKTNRYTFPVAEVSNSETKDLNVEYFPTKILITPQGNYIIIPFGFNWKELILNYCQISLLKQENPQISEPKEENSYETSFKCRNLSISLINQASKKIDNGSVKESLSLIFRAIQTDSTFHKSYDVLYRASLTSENYSDSIIQTFNNAKRVFELDDEICFYIAEIYRFRKNYTNSISEYSKAIELCKSKEDKSPLIMQYYAGRAYSYIKLNKIDEAISDYTIFLNEKPGDVIILTNRGVCYQKKGNNQLAIADWKISAELGNITAKEYLKKITQK